MFTLLVSLSIGIVVSRILGPERRGIYTFLFLLPAMAVRFGTFGIDTAQVYFIGQKRFALDDIKANALILSFVTSAMAVCVLLVYNEIFGFDRINRVDPRYLFLVLPLVLLGLFGSFFRSILLGLNRIVLFNITNLLKPVLVLSLLGVLYLAYEIDILTIVVVHTAASTGVLGVVWFYVRPGVRLRLHTKLFRESIGYGIKGYAANLMTFLNYRLDMLLIVYFLGMEQLGYYSISVLIAEQLSSVPAAFALVLFPRVSSQREGEENITPVVCRVNLLLALLGGLFLALVAGPAISFVFTADYSPAVTPLYWLMPGIVALSLAKVLASDLSGRGKIQYSMYTSSLALACNTFLNFILIPRYGINGAAIASSVTYFVSSVLFVHYYRAHVDVRLRDMLFVGRSDLEIAKASLRSLTHLPPRPPSRHGKGE